MFARRRLHARGHVQRDHHRRRLIQDRVDDQRDVALQRAPEAIPHQPVDDRVRGREHGREVLVELRRARPGGAHPVAMQDVVLHRRGRAELPRRPRQHDLGVVAPVAQVPRRRQRAAPVVAAPRDHQHDAVAVRVRRPRLIARHERQRPARVLHHLQRREARVLDRQALDLAHLVGADGGDLIARAQGIEGRRVHARSIRPAPPPIHPPGARPARSGAQGASALTNL